MAVHPPSAGMHLVGRRVRVVSLPPLDGLAPESQAAMRYALGRTFKVEGIGRYGHLELVLGPEADGQLGGFMNTVWLEPEHAVLAEDTPSER